MKVKLMIKNRIKHVTKQSVSEAGGKVALSRDYRFVLFTCFRVWSCVVQQQQNIGTRAKAPMGRALALHLVQSLAPLTPHTSETVGSDP